MLAYYLKRSSLNTSVYAGSAIIVRIISFLFLPYFLSKLSLAEFGIWDFYQTLFTIGTLLLSSNAAIGMTRFYLLYKNDIEKQKAVIGNAFCLIILSAIIFMLLIFGYFKFFLKTNIDINYIILSSFNIIVFSFFSLVLAYLRVKEYLKWYFVTFCGQSLIAMILTVIGVSYNFGIESFFYANGFSFLLFSPGFIYILIRNYSFSFSLLKEQLKYSIPLLAYSLLFGLFFSIDRFIIQHYQGYEALGTYALLWRFGSIFQFFSIALMDASPIIIFNAQNETESESLIAKIITYFCMTLTTGCLLSIIGARYAISLFLPQKYFFLIPFLPFFFLPIISLDIARLFQTGVTLSRKTIFSPILTAIALSIQGALLFLTSTYNLNGIFCANIISFIFYGFFGYLTSRQVYSQAIFDINKIKILLSLFFCYVGCFHFLFLFNIPWFLNFIFLASWPLILWYAMINEKEKQSIFTKIGNIIENYLSKKKQSRSINLINTLLYLKTDIYYHEIIAGGSVTHTLGVIEGFKKNNIKIICATSCMQKVLSTLTKPYFVSLKVWPFFCFLRWKLGSIRWHADCLLSTFYFYWQVASIFKKNTIDAIYQRYSWLNFTGILLSMQKKKPLILEFNGSEMWVNKILKKNNKMSRLFQLALFIEYLNLKYADYIVVVSDVLKDNLINLGISQNKILVNPNGVNPDTFNAATLNSARNIIRTQRNIQKKFVFGFIGTFSFWHGIEILAHAIPKIIELYPQAHFILIGDGLLKSYLMTELDKYSIEQNITFTGILPHEKAREYLAACNAFLSPTVANNDGSKFFGSPTKLFEYMSLAKPIITTNLAQIGEIINPSLNISDLANPALIINKQVGVLIEPNNSQELINAALALINLKNNDRLKLGANARKKVMAYYSWQQHVKHILNFVTKDKNLPEKKYLNLELQ
ncbi:MAG: glycosyltransferase [Candidatus Babeliales bacterium]